MARNQKAENKDLAERLFPTVGAEDFAESILTIPPEQRRLHTETYDFSITTVLDYFKRQHIFIPVFQRRYVWTQAQASRLIESLIIQCPIPIIYLNQEPDERLSVIDGNQRIHSIANFLDNQFELRGLTAYPELEGLKFFELDPRIQRHILNRTLRCIVIMKDTHPQVKFDVFERLNSGAVSLTPQELRHGIYHGPFVTSVERLAKRKDWKDLLGLNSDKRMRSAEFVIRFFAFLDGRNNYRKPLSEFLNKYCEKKRNISKDDFARLEAAFEKAIHNVGALFGENAFQVFDSDGTIQSRFNAALFDAEMVAAAEAQSELEISPKQQRDFLFSFANLLKDEALQKSITRATSDEQMVKLRIEMVKKAITGFTDAAIP